MKVILLTAAAALILIWGAILAIVKWIHPFETKHLLGFGGYVSVVSGILIYLVIQTAITRQEAALANTRAQLNQELDNFRKKLGEVQIRVMQQLQEKAELTQSEMEVRGNLQTERAGHARTRKELANVQTRLMDAQAELIRETDAHRAYRDSLNTERALHHSTRSSLSQEAKRHRQTRHNLNTTRGSLEKARERLAIQTADIGRLRKDLKQTETRSRKALENAEIAQKKLMQKAASQQQALKLLQASVDSIYRKVLKRPRVPPPPKPQKK